VGELSSAFDALAADDLYAFTDGDVLERVAELVRVVNRASAELTRTVRHADATQAAEHDGLKTMASWLRGHARLSSTAASRLVRDGRALAHVPQVAAAFADGEITAAQVGVIAEAVTEENVARAYAQDVDMAVFDQLWAAVAGQSPFDKLSTAVQAYRDALDPDGPEPDPTEGRRLSIATHADGSVSGRFDLDAVGGEKVQAALESITQADRPKGDLRSRGQQRADALVQLCDNQLATGDLPTLRTVKPHVVITVDLDDLAGSGTGHGAADTGFGATLSAARARWLACDAMITRIVLGPDGLPLDLGRTYRVVPPHLRRAVEQRDRHCVFAGCGAPTHWCDVHHLIEWINGGETSLENSALLCERHHTKVHHGFRVERDDGEPPGSRWRTYRPDGTEILVHPVL
jgi:hypothetical protein